MSDEAQAPASRQATAGPSAKPQAAGAKVNVYCKLPTGMYLQAYRMVESREPVLGGGTREFKIAEPVGLPVKINGNRTGRMGDPATHRVIGDYGVTSGVDKDLWDRWYEANRDQPYVVNKLIFAAERREIGDGEAEENWEFFTGLGPLLKDGDPRAPRAGANLTPLKDDRAA